MARRVILAIDEGTTNSKAVLVDQSGTILASESAPVAIEHPRSGWVQQDATTIWRATQAAISACLSMQPDAEIAVIGISNQRESILAWNRETGAPLGPVINWQCRRTSAACEKLRQNGHEQDVISKTGLPLDPLFPATKAKWLLDRINGTDPETICIGTVDSWLIWKLSGGKIHATDRSNAARTQLFDLARAEWDTDLAALFGVSTIHLPQVYDSAHVFGHTLGVDVLPDGIPIASAIGDSHAALFGHGATGNGDGKITFGTGSSMMTTVPDFEIPPVGITTTIAWSLGGRSTFAFEGNILTSASIFPWTAELLGLPDVYALMRLAQDVEDSGGVSLVPAHVGLGSPYWASDARGLIAGLSFGTKPAHIARAAADSLAHQVADIYDVMDAAGQGIGALYVDGGPSSNGTLMQRVADFLDHAISPCRNTETSALGAAYLAGLATGFWPDLDTVSRLTTHEPAIHPNLDRESRNRTRRAWRTAIERTILDV